MKLTIKDILRKKSCGEKITMLTAYDYPLAALIDEAGIDMILIGDSLANVVLGLESTTQVGMPEMLHHAKAVSRAVKRALVIGDMPYNSYQLESADAIGNARRFIQEAKCDAVKLEWFPRCLEVSEKIIRAGIPLIGHVGLTPQTADRLGGYKVQGRDAGEARLLIRQAKDLENLGCFALVLECIPDKIARIITEDLKIPTIGIGAGAYCDGQVLVTHDIIGLFGGFYPKFIKKYIDISPLILRAVKNYKNDVERGKFPGRKHSFSIKDEEFKKLIA